MPIRIREVHVKAMVVDVGERQNSSSRQLEPDTRSAEQADTQAIVAMCVEQVMRKLREKLER